MRDGFLIIFLLLVIFVNIITNTYNYFHPQIDNTTQLQNELYQAKGENESLRYQLNQCKMLYRGQ